jgi:hypothetical protein
MEKQIYGIIYKATNKINGKCYIGQTTQGLHKRKTEHINKSKNDNFYFHNSICKYGKNNFEWKILCDCDSKEELDEMEFHYIKQYDSYWKNGGYNLTAGGEGSPNRILSDETKEKISKAAKKRYSSNPESHPWIGRKHTEETKRKIGIKSSQKVMSEEARKKISKGVKGKGMCGKHHTEETKRKISKILSDGRRKGKNNNMYGKKHTEESKQKISKKALNRERLICEYCGKKVDMGNYSRWHGKNCKMKEK